ncbi:hypothetical protein BLA29_004259 [Euroglyphus maynei]|uniref:Uncharacterized protein n=1 Tax=Euroglyphus maynei TaxID=6958 RepID=A0A1Y3B3F7_EURMA|nr:hypothetical protein BLA29_004259 [Euroglyphus maynei]
MKNLNFSTIIITMMIECIILMENNWHQSSNVNGQSLMDNLYRFNEINTDIKAKTRDKCEIEILTRGSCMVNNNRIKPKIILHFKTRPFQSPADHNMRQTTEEEQEISESIEYKQRVIFEFTVQVIKHMKLDYGDQLKPLIIDTVQSIRLRNYGVADVYELKIYGLDEIEPMKESIEMENSLESSTWSFNITFYAANITADFKANINMDEKIFVKQWNLGIRIEQCTFRAEFTLDFNHQLLFSNSFQIKSFGDFKLISQSLQWPFNEIVSNIVQQEKHFIRHIIELYSQKYLNMTLSNNYDMMSILQKIFNDQ